MSSPCAMQLLTGYRHLEEVRALPSPPTGAILVAANGIFLRRCVLLGVELPDVLPVGKVVRGIEHGRAHAVHLRTDGCQPCLLGAVSIAAAGGFGKQCPGNRPSCRGVPELAVVPAWRCLADDGVAGALGPPYQLGIVGVRRNRRGLDLVVVATPREVGNASVQDDWAAVVQDSGGAAEHSVGVVPCVRHECRRQPLPVGKVFGDHMTPVRRPPGVSCGIPLVHDVDCAVVVDKHAVGVVEPIVGGGDVEPRLQPVVSSERPSPALRGTDSPRRDCGRLQRKLKQEQAHGWEERREGEVHGRQRGRTGGRDARHGARGSPSGRELIEQRWL
mmetsp:Transcript_18100/g.50648  ORF Transcript_18100/g.50648 Transcript_18100/m.50648 type:complete len:331 (-) Transcript_18100:272-1264(-)